MINILKIVAKKHFFVIESLYSISENSEKTQLSEIRTNFVLLPDSGGRFKRDTNESSNISDAQVEEHPIIEEHHTTDDDNKIYSSDENGSSRGHLAVEEQLLENVDI